ncbi:MAG: alginate export family protein [Myxococcota bacterium]
MRRWLGAWGLALAATSIAAPARAQLEPLQEGIPVGAWTFYPSLELRTRGEYRRHPVEIGRVLYGSQSPQAEAFASPLPEPVTGTDVPVDDQLVLGARSRLGVRATFDVLTAQFTLQDARTWGTPVPATTSSDPTRRGELAPWEAWVELRSSVNDPWLWVRLGRQPLRWGDGRLVGDNDWSPRGNRFDAARVHLEVGDVDVEAMAAFVAVPGLTSAQYPGGPRVEDGTGAQLYGLTAAWPVLPAFGVEGTFLARVVRDPVPAELARGDTLTADVRFFGDDLGLRYAIEGAYQFGRVAGYGFNWDVRAFAAAAYVDWRTSLPADLGFAVHGAYASGDGDGGQQPGDTSRTLQRFDPISPTTHEHHGLMDLYAWSNMFDAGLSASGAPVDSLEVEVGYTFVGLAEPEGRWTSANLIVVGAAEGNASRVLGHEVDVSVQWQPWEVFGVGVGYGAFVLGDGGQAIFAASGRGEDRDLLHYAYLQAELQAP